MSGPRTPVAQAPPRGGGRDRVEAVLIAALTILLLGQAALIGVAISQVREAEAEASRAWAERDRSG